MSKFPFRKIKSDWKRQSRILSVFLFCSSLFIPSAFATSLIEGEKVESGEATFERPDPNTFNVHQISDQLVLGFQSLGTAAGETINFIQPSSAASVWNRVYGGGVSQFFGTLNANGLVGIENSAGVVFGSISSVNVGSLIATTLHLSNENFLSGNFSFEKAFGSTPSFVINRGIIDVREGGSVALLGGAVRNEGTITAKLGSVVLASGEKITLSFGKDGFLSVVVDEALKQLVLNSQGEAFKDAVENKGTIKTLGGTVKITAEALMQIFDRLVNQTGIIEANAVEERGGEIFLVAVGGSAHLGGTLAANGGTKGSGGQIQIRATDGDVIMEPDTLIDLRGGSTAGNGGFGEVSATGNAVTGGTVLGDSAPGYKRGSFVFDPSGDLDVNAQTVTTDTIFFATRNVNIKGNVTANSGANLKFLADHKSATLQDWDDGTGNVNETGNKVVTTNGGGSLTFAGADVGLANSGVNASGNLDLYYNSNKQIDQKTDLTDTITAFSGTLGIHSTGSLKLKNDLSSTALFNGSNALLLESDSNLGGQAADIVDFNSQSVDTHGGNLTIFSRGSNSLPITSLSAGTGTVQITAGGAITDGNGASLNITGGVVNLTASNGGIASDLNASTSVTADAHTANGTITLASTAGDLKLATINAGTGQVTLTSNGAITDTNGATLNLTGGAVSLTASTGIGTLADPLETNLDSLSANVTGAGSINTSETDALTINNVTTFSGDVNMTAGGNLTLGVTNAGGAVNLTAGNGGSILDSNGALNNISASSDSSLTADGTIGLLSDPTEVNVTGGFLSVSALGQTAGVSVDINGTVAPSNTLLILGNPPGLVIFNGADLRAVSPLSVISPIGSDILFSPFFETIVESFALRRYRGIPA